MQINIIIIHLSNKLTKIYNLSLKTFFIKITSYPSDSLFVRFLFLIYVMFEF